MLATIRNRRGLVAAVEPFDSQEGRLHLVRVEYTDSDGVAEDTVLWAARWAALTEFLHPDGSGRPPDAPISHNVFGGVQVDDFQLVPLLKALEMPRVSLLLADDVGLGKTIESGPQALFLTKSVRN
jgi:hypothetical protein